MHIMRAISYHAQVVAMIITLQWRTASMFSAKPRPKWITTPVERFSSLGQQKSGVGVFITMFNMNNAFVLRLRMMLHLFWLRLNRWLMYNVFGSIRPSGRHEVSSVKCHFLTIMTIFMHQFEDRCHDIMH